MSGIWPRAVWGESGTRLHPGQLGQVPEMPHGPTLVIQDKKLSRFCVQMFLLIRNVCIYHPLLNELHLSTLIITILLLSKPISCESVMSQPFLVLAWPRSIFTAFPQSSINFLRTN